MKDYNSIYKWQNRKEAINSARSIRRKEKVINKNLKYGLLLEISIPREYNILTPYIFDRLYMYNQDAYYNYESINDHCYCYDTIHWKILESTYNFNRFSFNDSNEGVYFVLKSGKLGIFFRRDYYVEEFNPYIKGEVKELVFMSRNRRKFILPIERARAVYIEKDKDMGLDENNFNLRYKVLDYPPRIKPYVAGISERMSDL